jgi:hypothetical protein
VSQATTSEPVELSRYNDGLRAGRTGFDSQQGQEIFLYSAASHLALGPTQLPLQWVPGALSSGVKRPGGREYDHSPQSSAEVRSGGVRSPIQIHGMVLNSLSTGTALSATFTASEQVKRDSERGMCLHEKTCA